MIKRSEESCSLSLRAERKLVFDVVRDSTSLKLPFEVAREIDVELGADW